MEVVPYHDNLLPQLTQLVNDHIQLVPPGWTLTPRQVAYVLGKPNAAWTAHYPEDKEIFASHTVCMLENQQMVAVANWFFPKPLENQAAGGVLSWLFSRPGHSDSLEALVGAFIGQSAARGCASVYFCPRFGFGVGWFGIPDVWPHIIKVIQESGFEVDGKWVIMTGPAQAGEKNQPALDFDFVWQIDEPRLEWELEAKTGNVVAGECQAWGIPAHFRGCPGYEEWITIEWLGVEVPYQRKGLGTRLMREQMQFQAQRGVKNVIVWTETNNTAARKLNKSFGFTEGPECWVFQMAFK
jgi:ribosomal protein S18 acetylase RimI-like enzyme